MRYHGAKGNLSTSSAATEVEEKFEVLIDANDQLLERVVRFLTNKFVNTTVKSVFFVCLNFSEFHGCLVVCCQFSFITK